jgi:hypothetical protein
MGQFSLVLSNFKDIARTRTVRAVAPFGFDARRPTSVLRGKLQVLDLAEPEIRDAQRGPLFVQQKKKAHCRLEPPLPCILIKARALSAM